MLVKIKDVHVNTQHISMVALRGTTLVIDFAYSKPEGPVFLAFEFETESEAQDNLDTLLNA
jgi:hypothetical protein